MSLQVANLSKQFYDANRGEFLAVDNVSFDCKEGELVGLLGPNGAGKTTTLRMIAGILKPSSGNVVIDGFDLSAQSNEARKHIGFLSADTGLYERLTPTEILLYFGRLCRYPEENLKDRIDHLMKVLQIESFRNVRCEKLSTGMKQKVSIARALVHDPNVLAFDEPTNGLDVIAIRAMHDFLRECRTQGKCLLFSTHIMSEAEKLCDRIAIIHKGRIFAVGTLEELRAHTSEHYLEDIFTSIVQEKSSELL